MEDLSTSQANAVWCLSWQRAKVSMCVGGCPLWFIPPGLWGGVRQEYPYEVGPDGDIKMDGHIQTGESGKKTQKGLCYRQCLFY